MKINENDFIKKFECLYFTPESCPEDIIPNYIKNNYLENYKNYLKEVLDLGCINGSNSKAEEKVMEQLESSKFDEIALAWKAGKVDWECDRLVTTDSFKNDDKDSYINGYGGKIKKDAFDSYCEILEEKKEIINEFVDNKDWEKAYKTVMEISPDNIGPVYNINTLFFLTGGKAPIYDKFAHKAVKALLLDIEPNNVYLGSNPDKRDVVKVVAMYKEYMILLEKLFKDWFDNRKEEYMFIPRELDRALWVYGHSKKKYDER